MTVYQVIMITNVRNLVDPGDSFDREHDYGLFASLELADRFVEKHSTDQIEAEMSEANGVWISAYPKDDDFSYEIPCIRKSILIENRKDGELIQFDYFVKNREIKEAV